MDAMTQQDAIGRVPVAGYDGNSKTSTVMALVCVGVAE
jgi:hypothetical protein